MSETSPSPHAADYYRGLDYEPQERLGGVDGWMEIYDTAGWISEYRRTNSESVLDIEATAEALEVPLLYDENLSPSEAYIRGVADEDGLVPIKIGVSAWPGDKKLPFGHEIGHLFLEVATGLEQPPRDEKVEAFCEEFGRCLVLPPEELAGLEMPASNDVILSLMEKYDTDHYTVLVQLMIAGKLPRAIALDTMIGGVPNSYYANKVERHVICLDCQLCKHHVQVDTNTLPVYNFTDYEWSDTTSRIGCSPPPGDHDSFRALNLRYGTWNAEAEALHEDQKRRSRESREFLAACMRDNGLSDEEISAKLRQ